MGDENGMGDATPAVPPPPPEAGPPAPSPPATVVGYGRRAVEPGEATRGPAAILQPSPRTALRPQAQVPGANLGTGSRLQALSTRSRLRRWLLRGVIFVVALAAAAAAFVVIQNLPPDVATRDRIQQTSDQVAQTITNLMVSDSSTALAREGLTGATLGDVVTSCSGTADTLYEAGAVWSCRVTFVADVPALRVNEEYQGDITATAGTAGNLTFQPHGAIPRGPASFNLARVQQEYLGAVARYNAALPSLDAKVAAVRAHGGCVCGSDLVPVQTAVQQEVTALTALESHVPANISPDVSALIDAKRDMLADLSAMVAATTEASIANQEGDLLTRREDDSFAVKVRMDLGLPPPPGATPCNCGL